MKDSTARGEYAHITTSFYHHVNPPNASACGYLVDQTKNPDVLRLLFEHDPEPVYDLPHIHSEYRAQAFDVPLIIQPTTAQSEERLQRWMTESKALALQDQARSLLVIHTGRTDNINAFTGRNLNDTRKQPALFTQLDTSGCLRRTHLRTRNRKRAVTPLR